jgi:Asp-tRNA(Asn)/Glu-tRNA(Gln) amidotransferase A subunit family amidase
VELVEAVRTREVSPVELVQASLSRIRELDPGLNAFLEVASDAALVSAKVAEATQMSGEDLPPLHGIPLGIKDLHETQGIRTTYGSVHFADNVPDADSLPVQRLRAAGAIVVGKTNTPAFGLLGETKNRLCPPCCNPWNPETTTGGSSGGSAVAVATGMVPGATGSDSAGSIGVPASYCGVYGIKPTHGRVPTLPAPRDSLLFLDTGPMTRGVEDAALLLGLMSGHDARDPIALRAGPQAYLDDLRGGDLTDTPLKGLRVAYTGDLGHFAVDPELRDATRETAGRLAALGAEVAEEAPRIENPIELYMGFYVTDVRSLLARPADADHIVELFPETLAELAAYPELSAEDYAGRLQRLWGFRAAMEEFFTRFDLLVTPTTTSTAFPHSDPPAQIDGRPVAANWTGFMPITTTWNLTGQPAANVPVGLSSQGLPLGVTLAGRPGDDLGVLRASRALELSGSWLSWRSSVAAA